ncbi:MAG: glucose-6-phosphate 1-dehydrogenase [Oceanicoccus sp.]|jgi:glucose-6-phosphate 1-dehydrogenase
MTKAFDIVIFGGSGDLAQRKLLPALYRAFREGQLAPETRIIATSRTDQATAGYLDLALQALYQFLIAEEFSDKIWKEFKKLIIPFELNISSMDKRWKGLKQLMDETPDKTRIYYLAIPPTIFGICCQHLSEAKLISQQSRLVVEKPLGYDAESAEAINNEIANYFDEKNIYRIDHYMGKETVQNLLALRFTNLIFERLWDAKSIDHVQISISETVGLEGRAGFYNEAGALRDMVQNHLLQLLCLIAMEPPNKMNARNIQLEKIKVLEALRPITSEDVGNHTVRGQYVAGSYLGDLVPGYLEELNSATSTTETFVALRAYIDNWRWAEVPFYLRTGKRMKSRCAEVVIQFKDLSHGVFGEAAGPMEPNRLVIRLQPEEFMQLTMMSKNMDNMDIKLQPATLNLNFSEASKRFRSDSYKRLILDAAEDNSSLFIHRDEVSAAWAWIDPIIEGWKESSAAPQLYRAGTWGPDESDQMLQQDGRSWFNPGDNSESKNA